tara:strand:+ start:171 stop:413 length:243 start_codon:yes stop_codon:yes gene_type:complete
MDMIGVGLAVLGVGVPAAVALAKIVPAKNGASNGELNRLNERIGKVGSAISRLDERSGYHSTQIAELNSRVDTLIQHLNS